MARLRASALLAACALASACDLPSGGLRRGADICGVGVLSSLGSCIWLVAVRGARQLLGSTTCRRALVEPGLSPACRAALGTAPIGRTRHLRQAVPGCERVKRCSPGTARRRCHGRPVGAVPSAARQAGDNPGSAGGHADVLWSSTCPARTPAGRKRGMRKREHRGALHAARPVDPPSRRRGACAPARYWTPARWPAPGPCRRAGCGQGQRCAGLGC